MGVKYSWKDGFRANVKADTVGEVLDTLRNSETGLTAKAFVDISRPEESVTHKMFEWNDSIAAEKFREQQARVIIGHITVEYESVKTPQRAFYHLSFTDPQYRSVGEIKENAEDAAALLSMAKRELITFKTKYSILKKELGPVFEAIDNLNEKEN